MSKVVNAALYVKQAALNAYHAVEDKVTSLGQDVYEVWLEARSATAHEWGQRDTAGKVRLGLAIPFAVLAVPVLLLEHVVSIVGATAVGISGAVSFGREQYLPTYRNYRGR